MSGSMIQCQLWMGGLEPYMTESFIKASFQRVGEKPLNVKVMRNKFTGEPAGYCFVHFENDNEAIDAMHKLNGKFIPNTNPPIRFRLNTATNQGKVGSTAAGDREFSLWVGDLTADVDDYTLYKTFAARFQSLKAAKVILDNAGYSKGFGFLRFGCEEDQKNCLIQMNGFKGLGDKAIKISNAIPKSQRAALAPHLGTSSSTSGSGSGSSYDYGQYYEPTSSYWGGGGTGTGTASGGGGSGSYGWTSTSAPPSYYSDSHNYYGGYHTGSDQSAHHPGAVAAPAAAPAPAPHPASPHPPHDTASNMELVEHGKVVDVEVENAEAAEGVDNLWGAIASSYFIPRAMFEADIGKVKYLAFDSPRPVTDPQ